MIHRNKRTPDYEQRPQCFQANVHMHEYIRPPQQPKPLDGVGSVMHCKWELPALSGCTLHVRNHCNVCPRPMPLVDEQIGNGLNSTDIRIKTAVKKNPHVCQTNALLSGTASLVGAIEPCCDPD